ncbi:MAG: glutathione S-transferase family protein [Paracoccaceae bacterium]
MYTVIGSVASRAFRVVWMLEELGQPYRIEPVKPRSDAVLAHSALGKIPVLLDGDVPINDSAAIMTYLADKHGALTAPAGTLARAQQDAMTFRILDELDAVIWTYARHSFVLPPDQRVPDVRPSLQAEFMRNLAAITRDIQGPFVMGEAMTIPDILLVHCANWARVAKFPTPDEAFLRYSKAVRARAAFGRTLAQRPD